LLKNCKRLWLWSKVGTMEPLRSSLGAARRALYCSSRGGAGYNCPPAVARAVWSGCCQWLLQLRVRVAPAALLAMLRTALALRCVSKARDWTGHVDRWPVFSLLLTAIAGVRALSEPVQMQHRSKLSPRCCSAPASPLMYYSLLPCRCQFVVRVLKEEAGVTWVWWWLGVGL
jgi:hypothetical protein